VSKGRPKSVRVIHSSRFTVSMPPAPPVPGKMPCSDHDEAHAHRSSVAHHSVPVHYPAAGGDRPCFESGSGLTYVKTP
jgi:hypothetical protein